MTDRRVIYRETLFVLAGSLVLSLVMELVFLLLGRWRPAVLYGNLLTVFATTLNYYLMCRALLRAVAAGGDENNVKARMKASATGRMLLLGLIVAGGCYASVRWNTVDLWATLIPLLFVRLTLFVRSRMIAREAPPDGAPASAGTVPDDGKAPVPDGAEGHADNENETENGTADATRDPASDGAEIPPAAEQKTAAADRAPASPDNPETVPAAPAEPAKAEETPAAAPFRTDRHGRPLPPTLSELLKGGEPDDDR